MDRITLFSMVLVFIAGSTGCESSKKRLDQPGDTQPAQVNLEDVAPSRGDGDEAAQPGEEALAIGVSKPTQPTVETVTPDEPAVEPPSRTLRMHVVQTGDTLYKLARTYYGNQTFWRRIWEANRGKLPDPDQLKPGMELVIP